MKNQEFVNNEYPCACRYCEKGSFSFDESVILCELVGIVDPDEHCKKFVYDPLKRIPHEGKSAVTSFSAEDFSL